ncbi:MAG: ABC transporter permease subunit [Deferribacteraceae bacterium]|jgi:phosphate transport system permease protein|nr:ABC transporter permease subunit [Deferribacteraceae bacterium]
MIKYWSLVSSIAVTGAVVMLVIFLGVNAISGMSAALFFGDVKLFDAVLGRALVWDGLWTPLLGTLRLLFLTGLFAVPVGLSIGIYASEYARGIRRRLIVIVLESLAGLPSIIVGLSGFVLILFLRRYFFPANTCMFLAAFCLAILVLPVISLNTYTALKGIPENVRLTAASVGLGRETGIFMVFIPSAAEGIFSGLLLAAGRCAEDTAVILMTGAVAGAGNITGIFDKFEALPFFIYYTSANYRDETQSAQIFTAAFLLLVITLALLTSASVLKNRSRRWMR